MVRISWATDSKLARHSPMLSERMLLDPHQLEQIPSHPNTPSTLSRQSLAMNRITTAGWVIPSNSATWRTGNLTEDLQGDQHIGGEPPTRRGSK